MDLGPSICSIPWNGGLRSRRSIGLEVFEGLDPSESLDLEFPIPGILGFGGFEGSESLESLDLMISIPRILGIMRISIPNPPDYGISRDPLILQYCVLEYYSIICTRAHIMHTPIHACMMW